MQTFSQERQKLVVQSIVNLNLPIFLQMNEQVGLIIFFLPLHDQMVWICLCLTAETSCSNAAELSTYEHNLGKSDAWNM